MLGLNGIYIRISFIMPDAEDDENTDIENLPTPNNAEKMLSEIKREVREAVRMELQIALQFYSDKIDDYELKMNEFEKQCINLKNNCKNLTLKNEALEQRLNTLEQSFITNQLEIIGIKKMEQEDITSIAKKYSTIIGQNPQDITNVYRKENKRKNNSANEATTESATQRAQEPIVITLREGRRGSWLDAAKTTNVSARNDLGMATDSKVYLRESLTPSTAYLRWKAKTTLKDTGLYKYVWCKNGAIFARKEDKGKSLIIRSTNDISRLAGNTVTDTET